MNDRIVGEKVFSEDSAELGTIKEVRGGYVKVDASMQPDYWLRMDALQQGRNGLVVSADATQYDAPDETETETHQHMHQTAATAAPERRTVDTEQETLQLREERLRVEKEREQAGKVQLGKRVVERTETAEVPVREERVVIERRPASGEVVGGEITDTGETIEVPVERERVRAEKEAVVTEEVSVRTETVQRTEQVQANLRREELVVEEDGDVIADNANAPRQGAYENDPARR